MAEHGGPGPVRTQSPPNSPLLCCPCSSHFTEGKTEAQGGEVSGPRAHG